MTSRQASFLCPWARYLMGCLHLHVLDRWWGQAVYLSWWPSSTEDLQTEHESLCSVCTSSCILLSTIAQTMTSGQLPCFNHLVSLLQLGLVQGKSGTPSQTCGPWSIPSYRILHLHELSVLFNRVDNLACIQKFYELNKD